MAIDSSQICGTNFGCTRLSLDQWLNEMARGAFTNVELWGAVPHFPAVGLSGHTERTRPGLATRLQTLRVEFQRRGPRLRCLTPEQMTYPVNLAAREQDLREATLTYLTANLACCQELECPLMLVTPGWGYLHEPPDEAWKRAADGLSVLAGRAERAGIDLALEALQPFESRIVNRAADIRRMLDEVGSPSLHAALDTVAMACAGDMIEEYFATLAGEIRHCHFIDGRLGGHLAWPDGDLPLTNYLRALSAKGYAGMLSLEILNRRYWSDPARPQLQSREAILRALADINHATRDRGSYR